MAKSQKKDSDIESTDSTTSNDEEETRKRKSMKKNKKSKKDKKSKRSKSKDKSSEESSHSSENSNDESSSSKKNKKKKKKESNNKDDGGEESKEIIKVDKEDSHSDTEWLAGNIQEDDEEEYKKLLDGKLNGAPRGCMKYVHDKSSLKIAKSAMEKNFQNDMAFYIGKDDRPYYILFLKPKPAYGYMSVFHPCITMLNKGEFTEQELKDKFSFFEDHYQPNRANRIGKDSTVAQPTYSIARAFLSHCDLTYIELYGQLIIRRAREMEKNNVGANKIEEYPMSNLHTEPDVENATTATLSLNKSGVPMISFSKNGIAYAGNTLAMTGSKVSLYIEEFENIIKFIHPIWEEWYRMTTTRISITTTIQSNVNDQYDELLLKYITKEAIRENLQDSYKEDVGKLHKLITSNVRGKSSPQLKKDINANPKGAKEILMAWHLGCTSIESMKDLYKKVVKCLEKQENLNDE